MKYLLDTHTWIWWHMLPAKLTSKVMQRIAKAEEEEPLLLSAISVWEFSKLVEKGRLSISIEGGQWISLALAMPRLQVVPLDPAIAWQSTCLPQPFHDDPADQIIVATARHEGAVILTCDRRLRSYPHAKSLWD